MLVAQTGVAAALAAGALVARGCRGAAAAAPPSLRRVVPAALLAAAFAAPALLSGRAADGAAPMPSGSPSIARSIDRLVSDGHVVFVDVTADWCLTCKVNEQLVLGTPAVPRRSVGAGHRRDARRLDAAEQRHRRLSARLRPLRHSVQRGLWPGARRMALALSEILTPDQVLAALGEAAGPGRVAGTAR